MRPSLRIVFVIICIPDCCASDFMRKVFVGAELVIQRRMLARGLDAIREEGAGYMFFNGRGMVWIGRRQRWCHD